MQNLYLIHKLFGITCQSNEYSQSALLLAHNKSCEIFYGQKTAMLKSTTVFI